MNLCVVIFSQTCNFSGVSKAFPRELRCPYFNERIYVIYKLYVNVEDVLPYSCPDFLLFTYINGDLNSYVAHNNVTVLWTYIMLIHCWLAANREHLCTYLTLLPKFWKTHSIVSAWYHTPSISSLVLTPKEYCEFHIKGSTKQRSKI